ncbi:HAD-IIIA family hydrolase [Butyrivibrio fibrisolvens]|uniref:KdsC family phosphatase n=1 Tax=Pseudobutyrivibrio ruminis TaxID=46206 RepID=UPI00040812FF|nr:HAD-IIIA family hydrolase [Pseudobutyrivibrio ruminis]MDC7278844.1 HAD-IIIA family hydrolase [Butyrivibrio fibrisolvens]
MSKIRLIIIDVDGTLTDAGIYYDENGNELKKFCTKDAAGIFVAKKLGVKTMILTGRECAATTRRMTELKVDYLFQNVKDKASYLKEFLADNGISKEEVMYIGDDLNDLPPMALAGYIGCPADSCIEIKERANYVSTVAGGHGAVRDVLEHYFRETGEWEAATKEVYGIGV